MAENSMADLRKQRAKAKWAWKTLFTKGGTLGIWSYILTDEKLREVLPKYTPNKARLFLRAQSKYFMVGAAKAEQHGHELAAQIALLAKKAGRRKLKRIRK